MKQTIEIQLWGNEDMLRGELSEDSVLLEKLKGTNKEFLVRLYIKCDTEYSLVPIHDEVYHFIDKNEMTFMSYSYKANGFLDICFMDKETWRTAQEVDMIRCEGEIDSMGEHRQIFHDEDYLITG